MIAASWQWFLQREEGLDPNVQCSGTLNCIVPAARFPATNERSGSRVRDQ